MKKILIVPGHGGADPGCISPHNGLVEKDYTLEIAVLVASQLRAASGKNGAQVGDYVRLSRETDRDQSFEYRRKMELLCEPDLVLELHCNSFPEAGPHGAMAFHYPGSKVGQTVAYLLTDSAPKPLRRSSAVWPAEEKTYPRARNVCEIYKAPCVVYEMGFFSNKRDSEAMASPFIKHAIAAGIVGALCSWLYTSSLEMP